jgi:hypothetical protein
MKVLKVDNHNIRSQIELITREDVYTGVITFFQDVNGEWIVGKEVLDDPNFIEVRELLLQHGEEIDFAGLPIPEDLK